MTIEILLAASFIAAPPPPDPDRWFAEDKVRHFVASFVVTSMSASAARVAGFDSRQGVALGIGVGAVAGVLKEVHDVRSGTFFSLRDLIWDAGGVGAAALLMDATR